MSNDLLFPILPREGKVPIKTDERVKPVGHSTRSQSLSEEEKDTHEEERLIGEQQQHLVHRKAQQQASDDQPKQHQQESQQQESEEERLAEVVYDSHGETDEPEPDPADLTHHIDTYG